MALVQCKECKNPVSTSAKLCPHCGVANPGVKLIHTIIGFGLLAAIAVVGLKLCSGGGSEMALSVPSSVSPASANVLTRTWPEVRKACVGLDRYSSGIKVVGVQENKTLDVLVAVPKKGSGVPDRFMVAGQTCYFSVSRDGKQLSVSKEGCKALCLDRGIGKGDPLSKVDFNAAL